MNYKLHSEAIKYVGNKYENIDKDARLLIPWTTVNAYVKSNIII